MVKTNIFLIVVILFILSCSKTSTMDCENPDYSDCNTIEPINGDLTIIVTKLEKTSEVPLSVYKGKFGSPDELVFQDTVSNVETVLNLLLNNNYYAVATYQVDGKTINAVDGVSFEKKGTVTCDSTCWKVKNSEIDVRLKN